MAGCAYLYKFSGYRIKEIYGKDDESVLLLNGYIDEYLDKAGAVDSLKRVNSMMNTLVKDQRLLLEIFKNYPINDLDRTKVEYFQALIDSTTYYLQPKIQKNTSK